ncbi:hypothetical protein WMY93_032937 [Mugilogobius chulae]|uniref:Uncharacterized protein n=1 Tax=Mugilogobius chulae TaxID=88201 RepID=A0AAW0MMQ9_9GOBI
MQRHNRERLKEASVDFDVSVLELKADVCSRQDSLFMRKNAPSLYRHIFLAFKEESNGRDHYHALFVLLAVVLLELANEEVVVDLMRLELAVSNQEELSVFNRCGIQAVCAAFMRLLCELGPPPALRLYVAQVIENRRSRASCLLPEFVFCDSPRVPEAQLQVESCCLFVQSELSEALTGSSYGAHGDRLNCAYTPQVTDEDRISRRKVSETDLTADGPEPGDQTGLSTETSDGADHI